MFNRRNFLKSAAITGGAVAATPIHALASRQQTSAGFFGLHQFIENNPEAVFIMRTDVNDYMNGGEKTTAGLEFARSVFVPKSEGVPLTHLIPIKPNARFENGWKVNTVAHKGSTNQVQGYKGTDAFFVEGVIEAMKELGLSADQFFLREVNLTWGTKSDDYPEMAERTGVELRAMIDKVGLIDENDLVWVDTPDGVWYRKIPYLWPVNATDTFLVNIAKMKSHSMGLTLSAKNLQGCIAHNYQAHCTAYTGSMDMHWSHMNPEAKKVIYENYLRHKAEGVPRWDKAGDNTWNSGIGMETWGSRCLDNNAATPCGLHIIESIYGVDGHFYNGPHTENGLEVNNSKGVSWEYPMDYVIFGQNAFNCDIIGHWLGGHEAGNVGLFHMAIDRGLSTYLNPRDIPLYEWKDGQAVQVNLESFEQTDLLTYSMQRDYKGQTEDYWHLMNEPYDYAPVSVEDNDTPKAMVLHQNRPNPFNPNTSIEFSIPKAGNTRLEVYNASGQLMEVLADGWYGAGSHMVNWNTSGRSSGVYFYRFRHGGLTETKKMTLLK